MRALAICVLAVATACAGCVSAQRYERDTAGKYQTGYELGQKHGEQTCQNRIRETFRRGVAASLRAGYSDEDMRNSPLEERVLNRELMEAIALVANPETSDPVRTVLEREIRRMRMRLQEMALDRLSGIDKPNRFKAAGEKSSQMTDEEFRLVLDAAEAKTWTELCPKLKSRGLIVEASPCP